MMVNEPQKNCKNHEDLKYEYTMKNPENPWKYHENHEYTLENHENQPKTMENHNIEKHRQRWLSPINRISSYGM